MTSEERAAKEAHDRECPPAAMTYHDDASAECETCHLRWGRPYRRLPPLVGLKVLADERRREAIWA